MLNYGKIAKIFRSPKILKTDHTEILTFDCFKLTLLKNHCILLLVNKKQASHMRKQLLYLVLLVGFSVTGCKSSVKVEQLSFSHEDEFVRKNDFIVSADRRVFAVMAFMNACGYDEESPGKKMHPARVLLRNEIRFRATNHPKAFKKWKRFYEKAGLGSFHYLDFALCLNDRYPFKQIRPDSELGYPVTARKLAGFPAMLNEFCITLEMDQIWNEVKPEYLKEIKKYDFDKMARQLAFVWDYLKLERSDSFTFVSVPNLLDRHYHAIGAQYENYWYMVESPGAGSHAMNVHEYLHSIINPLVESNYAAYHEKLNGYFQAGKNQQLAKNYGHPVTYTSECLVRALDCRIRVSMEDDPATKIRSENRVSYLTKQGLLLVQPFYQLLLEYEQRGMDFEKFLPDMFHLLPDYYN